MSALHTSATLGRSFFLALCVSGAAGCGGGAASGGPSLLIVSLDTTRADHLSCYGYERPTTPTLDALAAEGHLFTDAHTVMATTLPSHTAMFTSLNPRELGVMANGMIVPPAADTLAERLAEREFATGAFVSAAVLNPHFGLAQGFETYDAPPLSLEERRGDVTCANAREWLRARGDERFFAFVHLFEPHTWYTAPDPWAAQFGAPSGLQPPGRDFLPDPAAFTPEVRRGAIDAYDAEIRYADELLAGLLEELRDLDRRDDTIVVVLSDHGETLDELIEPYGYAFDHGEFLHERELRIPLVLWLPAGVGPSGSSVQEELVTVLDLMPTLLDLLGVPCRQPALGRSLVPLLEGDGLPRRPALAERRMLTERERREPASPYLRGREFAVTTDAWHLVRCQGRPLELFERDGDSAERENVAAAHPDVVARLSELLDGWLKAHAEAPRGGARGDVDPELLEALRKLGYATFEPEN